MYVIALTGGIASGKSLVARRFAELGAVHVDADMLARDVVAPGQPALEQIAREFGPSVITEDGTLDRAALGAIIFADPAKRLALNAITHPAVWALALQKFAEIETANPDAVVIYDVPLLAEASGQRAMAFDLTVVVHAETSTRLRRLIELRGLSPEEANKRLGAQATDTERFAIADVVIDANGSVEHTIAQVDDLWARIRSGAAQ